MTQPPAKSTPFPYTTLFRSNYRAVGIRFFVLARAIRDRSELDGLGDAMSMPLRVVRLTLPLDEIERRLRADVRSEEHTSELQSRGHPVCRLLLEKKNSPYLT